MLDIQIFNVRTPVYDNKNKIGSISHISLGTYTALTPEERTALEGCTPHLTDNSLCTFHNAVHNIGEKFCAIHLLHELEKADHPILKEQIKNQFQKICPKQPQNLPQLQKEQKLLQSYIAQTFTPEEQVMMMIRLKNNHDQKKKANEITPEEDEIFARGIAECVQAIKDMPKERKSPLIRNLCINSTHRHYTKNHSRT